MEFLVRLNRFCKNNNAVFVTSSVAHNQVEIMVTFIRNNRTKHVFKNIGAEICPIEVNALFRFLEKEMVNTWN